VLSDVKYGRDESWKSRQLPNLANADRKLFSVLMFVVLIGVVAAILTALGDVRNVLANTSWPLAVSGFLIAMIAYAAIGSRFAALGRLAGITSQARMMTELGFISTSVGRVMVGGGTAGNVMRIAVLRRHGITMGETVAASLMHTLLNFMLVLTVFLAGVGLVITTGSRGSDLVATSIMAVGSVVVLVVGGLALTLFVPPVRRVAVFAAVLLARRLTGRDITDHATHFVGDMGAAVSAGRSKPTLVATITAIVIVEALAAMTVLWFTFAALGTPVGPNVLVAGFGIGSAAAMASMLPGGIGVQEGSMTAIFAVFGVELDNAIAAAILFRVLYFFVPFGISLLFYRRVLSRRGAGARI
jgi:uncharacterized protein (TIRG00374 family)